MQYITIVIIFCLIPIYEAIKILQSDQPHFVIEQSHLRIIEPQSIIGIYNVSMSNFGIPQYGAVMKGRIVVLTGSKGCESFEISSAILSSDTLPIMLVIERGDCALILKVYNGQLAGAEAVLIVNDVQETSPTITRPQDPYYQQIATNITIPSGMVQMEVGEAFKNATINGDEIVVELDWTESITYVEERVEWEFWFTGDPDCGIICDEMSLFLEDFASTAQDLEERDYTSFTPYTMFHKCTSQDDCSQCIKGGLYCTYQASTNPKQVAWQDLRHMCVHQEAKATGEAFRWWIYITYFLKNCKNNFTDDCGNRAVAHAGINVEAATSHCMGDIDSIEILDIIENSLDEMQDSFESGRGSILLIPTVVINYDQYRGSLNQNAVLRAICSGFQETTEPDVCLSPSIQPNDCQNPNTLCPENTKCIDTFRGYTCQCLDGYTQSDDLTCMDIDECISQNTTHPVCDQVCINTPGGYRCECLEGYQMHVGGSVCTVIDLCAYNNGGCEDKCVMLMPGKRECGCGDGLVLDDDEVACRDVDECQQETEHHQCQQKCVNIDPRTYGQPNRGYVCECFEGYEMSDKQYGECISIDTSDINPDSQGNEQSVVVLAILMPILGVAIMIVGVMMTWVMCSREQRMRRQITLDAIDITTSLLQQEMNGKSIVDSNGTSQEN
eukprot:TRINITY_DN1994_c0_g1_i3.p1 TRINITY_DN1994_c0_g1~~TRINITY_DN1994_c0_g1_i3.p1  ORF type:complete len:669 (-),score=41.36 TRINITY_DN1994_c0_g1_i3:312-2318(-)